MSDSKTIVVTRHPALVDYLLEIGLIQPARYTVIEHAAIADVAGKNVVGVLPLRLAAEAATVTEVPLELAPEDRGQELSLERLRAIAGKPVTYMVMACEREDV